MGTTMTRSGLTTKLGSSQRLFHLVRLAGILKGRQVPINVFGQWFIKHKFGYMVTIGVGNTVVDEEIRDIGVQCRLISHTIVWVSVSLNLVNPWGPPNDFRVAGNDAFPINSIQYLSPIW